MSDKPSPTIILINESALESWKRDASTFVLFIFLIGTGWLLNSAAMEWTGAIIGFITVLSQSKKREWRCTIDEAKERLNKMELT